MKRLLDDIESEIYDAVVVVDYDRLSRGDMGEQDKIKKIFRKSNTLIITPNKIYDLNNDIDDTYTDFQGLLAPQEYKMITKRLRQGIRTCKGKLWGNIAIYRILTNETYLGKIISNKQKGDGHKIKKASSEKYQKLPRKEWIIVENCHQPIITQDEFDKIQILIQKRTLLPTAARTSKGEFTGILKCGCCGHTMQVQKKEKGKDLIKACHYLDVRGNKCINRGGYLQPVRDEIKKAITQYREEILNKLQGENNRDVAFIRQQLQIKYKELKKYEAALEKVQDSYELGEYSREKFLIRKSKWDTKITETENQINLLDKQLKSQEQITDE